MNDAALVARKIVFRILSDMNDRRGLSHAWEEIDDEIKNEIIAEWIEWTKECLQETQDQMTNE